MLSAHDGPALSDRTILFVDDDDDTLAAFRILCENEGMRVLTARNLLTALNKLGQAQPDIICVDLNMPTGSGLEFCESLAGDDATSSIPRIILTGSPERAAKCTKDEFARR